MIEGGRVEVEAEEVEEVVGVDLSVGVPKKYEKPESFSTIKTFNNELTTQSSFLSISCSVI